MSLDQVCGCSACKRRPYDERARIPDQPPPPTAGPYSLTLFFESKEDRDGVEQAIRMLAGMDALREQSSSSIEKDLG